MAGLSLLFAAMGVVLVFGDLAQPNPHIAVAPEPVQPGKGLAEGFGGELLGQLFAAAKAAQIEVYVPEIKPVQLLHTVHPVCPLSPHM